MNPFFLRVLLAADSAQHAAPVEHYLHEIGHQVVRVAARADVALKAVRLVHPDLVVISGPLSSGPDGAALAEALRAGPAAPPPVLLVPDPTELPGLLARQAPTLAAGPSAEPV